MRALKIGVDRSPAILTTGSRQRNAEQYTILDQHALYSLFDDEKRVVHVAGSRELVLEFRDLKVRPRTASYNTCVHENSKQYLRGAPPKVRLALVVPHCCGMSGGVKNSFSFSRFPPGEVLGLLIVRGAVVDVFWRV